MRKKKTIEEFVATDFIDKRGNAVVNVTMPYDKSLFSPYSDKKMLNRDVLNYLDTITDGIPNERHLIINFIVPNKDKIDRDEVKEALRRYYWISYEQKNKDLKKDTMTGLAQTVLGLAAFVTGVFFNSAETNFVFRFFIEFSFLISWLLMWEGISQFMSGRKKKIFDRDNEKQLALATVRFVNKRKFREQKKAALIEESKPSEPAANQEEKKNTP
jgi:hypothetical protein